MQVGIKKGEESEGISRKGVRRERTSNGRGESEGRGDHRRDGELKGRRGQKVEGHSEGIVGVRRREQSGGKSGNPNGEGSEWRGVSPNIYLPGIICNPIFDLI